jgi:hypothetical protein
MAASVRAGVPSALRRPGHSTDNLEGAILMRKVIIERHSYKTKQVLDSPRGPIDVEIETLTIMTTMVSDDEEEAFEYCPFEEALLVPPPKRISRRSR